MQAEIDQLKRTKPETAKSQPETAPTLQPAQPVVNAASRVPAVYRKADNKLQAPGQPSPVSSELPSLTPEQEQTEQELQRGPEIADVTPTTPALKLGPAKIRLIG